MTDTLILMLASFLFFGSVHAAYFFYKHEDDIWMYASFLAMGGTFTVMVSTIIDLAKGG